jgi:branched-subunit amino acid transport protein
MGVVMISLRVLPLFFCASEIKNKYAKAFLSYIPYAVLTAMTIPEVFSSTSDTRSAVIGLIVACVFAYLEKSLIVVCLFATAAVFVTEQIITMLV